ncbi:MAG: hypothetical protein QOJ73_6056 [Streptosporangiaceae bacterium]|nr:hypothetical protein [Streptosporangiaceae bacterium]
MRVLIVAVGSRGSRQHLAGGAQASRPTRQPAYPSAGLPVSRPTRQPAYSPVWSSTSALGALLFTDSIPFSAECLLS